MERRFLISDMAKCEVRKVDGRRTITGYAAVFYREGVSGTEFQLSKNWVERIAPTAFDNVLKRQDDVRGLFNHDSNMVLGRTRSGTMRLSKDGIGLRYDIDLDPDSNVGNDVAAFIKRGDVDGSSFGFTIPKDGDDYTDLKDGRTLRTVNDIEPLYDAGPVTFPAYEASTTGLRSTVKESVESGFKAHEERKARLAGESSEVSKAKLKRNKQLRTMEAY